MVTEMTTRKVVKLLVEAGWTRVRTAGSHSVWSSADGTRSVTVPDGHRVVSPGVVRQVVKALAEKEGER